MSRLTISVITLAAAVLAGCATTPEVTDDGLVRADGHRFADVYVRPGADLAHYQHLQIADCEVAFRKNWLRDQNRDSRSVTTRLRQDDADRIRSDMATACDEEFRAALLKPPAYSLVEAPREGEDTLILQPAIVNLDINAPDVQSSARVRSYTTSAGEMTLVLELVDGVTGEVQARVVDRRRGIDQGMLQWTSSVTNRAEFNRILKRWADLLRDSFDRVRAGPDDV